MMDNDDELARLYRSARAQEAPTNADRAAVHTALLSALTTSAVVTASTAASARVLGGALGGHAAKALSLGKLALWVGSGVALGSAVSSAAWVLAPAPNSARSAPAVARVVASSASVARRTPPAALAERSPPASVEAEPVASAPSAKVGVVARQPVRLPSQPEAVSRVSSASPSSSLLAESEGLLAIQRALAKGDAASALSLSNEQDARFVPGALGEERAVLRVLTLCAAGRVEQARALRAKFSIDYPHSPHEKRLQNSCAKR